MLDMTVFAPLVKKKYLAIALVVLFYPILLYRRLVKDKHNCGQFSEL